MTTRQSIPDIWFGRRLRVYPVQMVKMASRDHQKEEKLRRHELPASYYYIQPISTCSFITKNNCCRGDQHLISEPDQC